MTRYQAYWRRLSEGEVKGWVMPLDAEIGRLRREGLSVNEIGRRLGKRKGYVHQRLLRIAAREG